MLIVKNAVFKIRIDLVGALDQQRGVPLVIVGKLEADFGISSAESFHL